MSLLRLIPRKPEMVRHDAIVFADPVYTRGDSRLGTFETAWLNPDIERLVRGGLNTDNLPRLTGTGAEARAILELFPDTSILEGFAADRRAALDPSLENYRVIHFAAHGILDEARPEHSGIALSRFAENGEPRDGFIRLGDVSAMNLNADLVVISACDTAVGKELRGEGLMSLSNAFLQAGSRSVMASLWKVDDSATKELMSAFYRHLGEGRLTPSQALREAQIELRGNPLYSSPYFWAAFTVQGDFNYPLSLTRHSGNFKIGTVLAAVLLFAAAFSAYLLRKRRLARL